MVSNMTIVNSVLGPLDTTDFGFTLAHEHLIVAPAGVWGNYPELFGDNLMERIVSCLKRAKEGGIDTIVDASTLDKDREVALMAEASRQSGVNIIAATGWCFDLPRYFAGVSAEQFGRLFTREIEVGISGTGIKAGVLKAGSERVGVTPQDEIILRAVARAHLNTGVPIMLHSYVDGRVDERQLAILREEGVALNRVKVDHSNDTTDVEHLLWLLDQGCYLGMDHYPSYRGPDPLHEGHNVTPEQRTRTLKTLIDAGYASRLCPSHDWIVVRVIAQNGLSEEERLMLNPLEFLSVKQVVIPELREMGVAEATLRTICVDGPRNFFEGV